MRSFLFFYSFYLSFLRFFISKPPTKATSNALAIGEPTAAWQLKPSATFFKGLFPLVSLEFPVEELSVEGDCVLLELLFVAELITLEEELLLELEELELLDEDDELSADEPPLDEELFSLGFWRLISVGFSNSTLLLYFLIVPETVIISPFSKSLTPCNHQQYIGYCV